MNLAQIYRAEAALRTSVGPVIFKAIQDAKNDGAMSATVNEVSWRDIGRLRLAAENQGMTFLPNKDPDGSYTIHFLW